MLIEQLDLHQIVRFKVCFKMSDTHTKKVNEPLWLHKIKHGEDW